MRSAIAVAVVLAACTPTTPTPSPTTSPPEAQITASPTAAPVASPTGVASAAASPSSSTLARPVSAGRGPDPSIVFFSDYGPPEGQLGRRVLYRYEGATGTLTELTASAPNALAVLSATGIAHDSAVGVYVRGLQGRWDLMHWGGTRATDAEFTACQVSDRYFASWCTVTPQGVGIGWGFHVGRLCGAAQFIRFPGDASGRPIPAELCVIGAWANDDGSVVIASGFIARGPVGSGCASDQIEEQGTCYRRETWVLTSGGSNVRTLQIPALPGFVGEYVISPDGKYAAASHLGGLFLVDLSTGGAVHLGAAASTPRWSKDGRLVFVRGSGGASWSDRTVVVAATDGSTREVRGYKDDGGLSSGLAPVWDPAGKRLAWIASPNPAARSDDPARDYIAGRGVGDRRVLVSDLSSDPLEIRCGEGVAEGVRWSHDGSVLLILCRRAGLRLNAFDLWWHPLELPGGHSFPLVRGLTLGGVDPNGNAPDILVNTAWSRGLTLLRP